MRLKTAILGTTHLDGKEVSQAEPSKRGISMVFQLRVLPAFYGAADYRVWVEPRQDAQRRDCAERRCNGGDLEVLEAFRPQA